MEAVEPEAQSVLSRYGSPGSAGAGAHRDESGAGGMACRAGEGRRGKARGVMGGGHDRGYKQITREWFLGGD